MTRVLKAEGEEWIEEAVAHLRENKLVVFPTETVYGIGTNLEFAENIHNLQKAKGRAGGKPITIMTGTMDIAMNCFEFDELSLGIARKFLPGPLTLVLKRGEKMPLWFFPEREKIGLRIPGCEAALRLLKAYGDPLAVTSANTSGSPPATNFEMALFYFANEEELLIIDGGESEGHPPSTVAEVKEGQIIILRQGPITREEIEAALNDQ